MELLPKGGSTSPVHSQPAMDDATLKLTALVVSVASFSASVCALKLITKAKKKNRSRKPYTYKRAALLRPIQSIYDTPWFKILSCGTDSDFLISLNFTKSLVLQRLLPYFEYERSRLNYGSPYRVAPKTRGRHPQLRSVDLLGLALWYLKTRGTKYNLCPIFGIVPASITVWLDFSLEVLLNVVEKRSRAYFEIRWPTEEEMLASSLLLQHNREYGPLLKGVFAVTDGGRMPCADYTEPNLQNAYYEGFTQSVEVTNLFVWNFYGEIIHAGVNFPGSWHDTKLAGASGLYYPKLSYEMTPPGYAILGDSAFVNNTTATNGKVLRGRKSNETREIPESAALAAVDALLQRIMPSERQSAEWGVRALKGPFQRLKTPLPADSVKRLRLLRICCHLFNFRTRYVGLNQIRTTYTQSRP